mgnify:CR=1 FL=1
MTEQHLARLFRSTARRHGHRVATRVPRGNGWRTATYERLAAEVEALAKVLIDLGVQTGDRVAIFSCNRPEWSAADLAALSVRAVVVPVFPTATDEQLELVLAQTEVSVAFVASAAELDAVQRVWPRLPALRTVVAFDTIPDPDPRVTNLDTVRAKPPSRQSGKVLQERLEQAGPEDLASIVYTSGRHPHGVMLSHGCFTRQLEALEEFFTFTPPDHSLCLLPLAHALERAWTYGVLTRGCLNTYVPDPNRVAELLTLVRPTLLVSTPRLYHVVYEAFHRQAAPSRRRLLRWATQVGLQAQEAYRAGRQPSPAVAAQLPLADRLVLSQVREAVGGPKHVMACGGGRLRREVEDFFSAAGMLVCQGYGMTEAAPLIAFNSPQAFKVGTVGRPMPGSQVRVDDEGEIWYRGPNVMLGYWQDEEATSRRLVDGWLRTGDHGEVDADGFLTVAEPTQDNITTSTGDVAPAPVEEQLLADPLFEQAVLLGDGRPYLTVLLKPSREQLEALAEKLQLRWHDVDELVRDPRVLHEVRRRVSRISARLPRYQRIGDLRLLAEDLTREHGLMTGSLRARRRRVERRFAALVEEMYGKARSG